MTPKRGLKFTNAREDGGHVSFTGHTEEKYLVSPLTPFFVILFQRQWHISTFGYTRNPVILFSGVNLNITHNQSDSFLL